MSKTKPITTLVTASASFRHGILAIAILGVIFCIQCHHQQSFVDAFTVNRNHNHHHHRADQGVARLYVPTLVVSSTPLTLTPPTTVSLQASGGFFGGMFGGATIDQKKDEKKDAVLAMYDVGINNNDNINVQFESLSDYIINKWAPLFLTGTIKLTTDVEVLNLPPNSSSSNIEDGVEATAGCQLIFKKIDTGYKSKNEEGEGSYQRQSSDNNNDDSKKKKEEKKQGGVEILVEKLSSGSSSSLQVRAKRCEVEDDTMIKEMSEEVIIQELQKAIDVWKKER